MCGSCCTHEERGAVRCFLSQETADPSTVECLSALFADKSKVLKNIYLLRGLLAHGILLLCLKKRWNVQYGLHPCRDPVAVPFHAKESPQIKLNGVTQMWLFCSPVFPSTIKDSVRISFDRACRQFYGLMALP